MATTEGFNPATGYVDLDNGVQWRLYTERRLWGGAIVGPQAAGKTRLLHHLTQIAATEADTEVWHTGDDPSRALHNMNQAMKIAYRRAASRSDDDDRGFAPTRHEPGILVAIDGCQEIFRDDPCRTFAHEIVQVGGKVGVGVIVTALDITVDHFGGDAIFRNALTAHNLVALPGLTTFPAPTAHLVDSLGGVVSERRARHT